MAASLQLKKEISKEIQLKIRLFLIATIIFSGQGKAPSTILRSFGPAVICLRGQWIANEERTMSKRAITLNPACIKTLAAVEARLERSNQHEFNGVAELKNILGHNARKIDAVFYVRGTKFFEHKEVTWYDSRKDHPTRSEYRLYFPENSVMKNAQEGDNIIIGFSGNQLHCILIPNATVKYDSWTPCNPSNLSPESQPAESIIQDSDVERSGAQPDGQDREADEAVFDGPDR